jgi:hypothetical protein
MDHLTKMYTVRKNVCQMLEDRGFLVGEVSCHSHSIRHAEPLTHGSSTVVVRP